MSTVTINYASAASITITLDNNLADDQWRESTAVDNATTTKYVDALVGGKVKIGAVSADGQFEIYAYGSYDGTEYTAGLTGSDGEVTWGTTGTTGVDSYKNLPLLGVVSVDTTDDDDVVTWGPFPVAQAFGGLLPPKWGIVVHNKTGVAFNSTTTSNECQFTGIKFDVA